MRKLLAPLLALAVAFASIDAFAADAPAKEGTQAQKADKSAKKTRRTAKKSRAPKAEKSNQAAPSSTK